MWLSSKRMKCSLRQPNISTTISYRQLFLSDVGIPHIVNIEVLVVDN